jgi:cobaltochelatase CobN
VLDSDAFSEHEGGFAAAAAMLGASPSIYHLDVSNPNAPRTRNLKQEIARALRGRAANPRWLRGQMRHGYRGAAEIAESVDNLFLFAATTDLVSDALFDLLFEAVCVDREVREFLRESNPGAALAIAKRFDEALRRRLWRSRRNSVEEFLSHMREAA